MNKVFLLIFLLSQIPKCFADYDRAWMEFGSSSWENAAVKIKFQDLQKAGWAFGYSQYDGDPGYIRTGRIEQNKWETFNPLFKTASVSRFISATSGWGYADAGIGLGVGTGSWTENCGSLQVDGLFFPIRRCDEKKGTLIGIPFYATAVLGRYAGIGLYVEAFYTQRLKTQVQAGIAIPIGKFTK
ncbi:hypothetical protein DWB84_10675 [Saccharophagus sp. K07]|jgi:hypothetical protein|uniref:hypothetical protein n=1 Tax=Saccharophagus sp. K07 TaxID=2283636 RepID=UPI0016524BD3|nr:hypothetical protein [Saccharophagus sp. K07]MBC6905921.1 hypothetical protein [Saccharophagus sp. K07]